jgi:hypothetical protein
LKNGVKKPYIAKHRWNLQLTRIAWATVSKTSCTNPTWEDGVFYGTLRLLPGQALEAVPWYKTIYTTSSRNQNSLYRWNEGKMCPNMPSEATRR